MSVRSMEGRLLRDGWAADHAHTASRTVCRLYTCTESGRGGRNLQLRLRDGDLPLEGGLRLALRVRLHVRLTGVAVVEGTI